MNEAIILAGGLGTRLSGTVKNTQKVMAPVGGRPFLAYILTDLKNKGFKKVVLAVSFHFEQIKEYFSNKFEGISILYSIEKVPLGTGGAIKNALRLCESDEVLILNGDTYFAVDYNSLYNYHKEKRADITLAAKFLSDCTRHSTLKIESDGLISDFKEKYPQKKGYINGGVYIIRKNIFDGIKKEKFSFEKDILEIGNSKMYAKKTDSYFIDMGIPESYFNAHTQIPLIFGENKFPALFLDRDGVICKEKHHLYKTEDFEFINNIPETLEKFREKGFLLIVITNQAGVAKGLYTENDVKILHEFMCEKLKDTTYIDALYYCPYHEAATVPEYKKHSPDRKPGDGMIKKAIEDFKLKGIEIDLSESILVGDKLSDIEAGKKAGVALNVLVRSGHKIDENTTLPDKITENLQSLYEEIYNAEI